MTKLHRVNADIFMFWCPGCEESHGINSTWTITGDADCPTVSPSVLVISAHRKAVCHSYIRDGKIEFLGDCTHALAGQTVDLPDWDAWVNSDYTHRKREDDDKATG